MKKQNIREGMRRYAQREKQLQYTALLPMMFLRGSRILHLPPSAKQDEVDLDTALSEEETETDNTTAALQRKETLLKKIDILPTLATQNSGGQRVFERRTQEYTNQIIRQQALTSAGSKPRQNMMAGLNLPAHAVQNAKLEHERNARKPNEINGYEPHYGQKTNADEIHSQLQERFLLQQAHRNQTFLQNTEKQLNILNIHSETNETKDIERVSAMQGYRKAFVALNQTLQVGRMDTHFDPEYLRRQENRNRAASSIKIRPGFEKNINAFFEKNKLWERGNQYPISETHLQQYEKKMSPDYQMILLSREKSMEPYIKNKAEKQQNIRQMIRPRYWLAAQDKTSMRTGGEFVYGIQHGQQETLWPRSMEPKAARKRMTGQMRYGQKEYEPDYNWKQELNEIPNENRQPAAFEVKNEFHISGNEFISKTEADPLTIAEQIGYQIANEIESSVSGWYCG